MNTKARLVLVLTLPLLAVAALWVTLTQAAPEPIHLAQGGAPAVVSYQGEVQVNDAPYTGDGYFKFAVVNAAGDATYWSNDDSSTGGSEPTAAVRLTVSEGLFSVLLGDTTLDGMTQALTPDVFSQPSRYLRVWFSSDNITFDQLTPDTRIAAVPYALQAQEAANADTVDGLHASELGAHYQNTVVVAKSGGDYTSVQAAIDSITDAAVNNRYLVWVAPGVYSEMVTMKPYVHLQGAGQGATVITSTATSGGDWPPTQATLLLASDTSLRDLTVGNSGAGDNNSALLATVGMTRARVSDVTAQALGDGVNNTAIFVSGSGTGVTLQQVTALAENGSSVNIGLVNHISATASLYGGSFTARGGTNAWGIFVLTATLEAKNVTALGKNGSNLNVGLYNYNTSTAVLYGGDYTGRGGGQTRGVENALHSTVTALGVTALAEDGSSENYGLGNYDVSTATLGSGVFTARGGADNYALSNELNGTMKAENVTTLAENGSNDNYGLWNSNNATLMLHSASLTGRGGTNAYGIYNGNGTTLEAESVAALGENGSSENYGLYNVSSAEATLRDSSLTGGGGTGARGIYINGSTLEATSITALAENASSSNYGLDNHYGAATTLSGGSFTGRGGQGAIGIVNFGTLAEARSLTALGETGSSYNYGLYSNSSSATANVTQGVLEGATYSVLRSSGAITVSNSRLAGNVVSGTVTCVLVTRGTNISTDGSTCP
jgi:hypothetical protein